MVLRRLSPVSRLPLLAPDTYRRITFAALLALAFIIVTGGAVRLTESGLGCPDWPTCAENRVVAPWEYHAMVEFVNRVVTGLVSLAVILAVLGSLRRRPRRPDLVRLSVGLVAGVVGQIILGGLTVRFELAPQLVMSHMLLSMVILANAVVLHHRAGQPEGPARPVVDRDLVNMGRLMSAAAALVIFLGTVVTSSGPHGGDPKAPRLALAVGEVARFHGAAMVLFLALTVVTLWRLARAGAPRPVSRQGEILLAVLVAQAVVGYVQYFTGVPVVLVGLHIAGAAAVWAATVRFHLALFTRAPSRGHRAGPPAGGAREELLASP